MKLLDLKIAKLTVCCEKNAGLGDIICCEEPIRNGSS